MSSIPTPLNCKIGKQHPGARRAGYGLGGFANDAFQNAPARTGFGTPSLLEATEYPLIRWSNNYFLMLTLFRNHWIARRIVEAPAQDMVRAWPKITSEMPPDELKAFDRCIAITQTQARVLQALKWARLYGGAGALIVVEGQERKLDEPLDIDSVGPGQYKGLIPFDRWTGIWPEGDISSDLSRPVDFGYPEYYNVNTQNGSAFRVHASRILRFTGPDVPQPEYSAQMYWGLSVLEPAFEEIRKRDNLSWSILALSFRAQILAQVNPELAQMLSGLGMNQQAQKRWYGTLEAQNQLLSNQSMLVLGKDCDLKSQQYTFGGLADIYQQFQLDIAGAAEIPVTVLFGRTLTGLGQSNDADMRIYEKRIAQGQQEELRPQLEKLFPIICMSELGEVPDDLDFEFPSVRVLTEEEKANLAKDSTESVLGAFNASVIAPQTALKELKQQSQTTGVFTNITDEEVAAASDKVEPAGEGDLKDLGFEALEDRPKNESEVREMLRRAAVGDAAADAMAMDAETFREEEHPRVKSGKGGGQFTKGSAGGSSAKVEARTEKNGAQSASNGQSGERSETRTGERNASEVSEKRAATGAAKRAKPEPPTKAELAKIHYRATNYHEQRIADESEQELSKALRMKRTADNSAFDLEEKGVGIEIKTFISNTNDKITMSGAALERKLTEAKARKLKTFVVVIDKRGQFTQYYWANRLGSLRTSTMNRAKSVIELKRAIGV